jgi:hypothetical protein
MTDHRNDDDVASFDGAAIAKADREFLESLDFGKAILSKNPWFGAPKPKQPVEFYKLSGDKEERKQQYDEQKDERAAAFASIVEWMLANYVYYPGAFRGKGGAISISRGGAPLTEKGMMGMFAPYAMPTVGERGALSFINPATEWRNNPRRGTVDEVVCRSDKERPLYCDGNKVIYNSYRPPVHPTEGGDIAAFEAFLTRLVPAARERAWFWNYLSYKARHPWVPMIGVIMVAEEYGSGRGTLFEILSLVFGQDYVVPVSYDELTKTSGGAARFNSWRADALFNVVHEAVSEDGVQQNQKRLQYEQLKLAMDPAAQARKVEAKGEHADVQVSASSVIIGTNHRDITKLPRDDRRICVLLCGHRMTLQHRKDIRDWMAKPENIGALYRALLNRPAVSESVFDPYGEPPAFAGRLEMIGVSETRLEDAYSTALAALQGCTLFTLTQMLTLIGEFGDYHGGGGDWSDKARYMVTKHAHRLRKKDEPHNRVRYHGRREIIFARTAELRTKWQAADPRLIAEQLDRTGKVIEHTLNSASTEFGKAMRDYQAGRDSTAGQTPKNDSGAATGTAAADDEK